MMRKCAGISHGRVASASPAELLVVIGSEADGASASFASREPRGPLARAALGGAGDAQGGPIDEGCRGARPLPPPGGFRLPLPLRSC